MVEKKRKGKHANENKKLVEPKYIAKSIGHGQSLNIKKTQINLWGNIEAMK